MHHNFYLQLHIELLVLNLPSLPTSVDFIIMISYVKNDINYEVSLKKWRGRIPPNLNINSLIVSTLVTKGKEHFSVILKLWLAGKKDNFCEKFYYQARLEIIGVNIVKHTYC